jgi:hypothetical protein
LFCLSAQSTKTLNSLAKKSFTYKRLKRYWNMICRKTTISRSTRRDCSANRIKEKGEVSLFCLSRCVIVWKLKVTTIRQLDTHNSKLPFRFCINKNYHHYKLFSRNHFEILNVSLKQCWKWYFLLNWALFWDIMLHNIVCQRVIVNFSETSNRSNLFLLNLWLPASWVN